MEKTIDNLEVGDEIEWEDSIGQIHSGKIYELADDGWSVHVNFFNGNFVDHAEVRLMVITKINGVEV
jgi:hypothetical protein